MKDIVAITVNWLTAKRTHEAVESIQKYYPDLMVYIVDDGSLEKDKGLFYQVYHSPLYNPDRDYNPDTERLKHIPGTTFIQVPTHRRHGESLDYALKRIASKWIFHIDSDVRLIKKGAIEYMMRGVNDRYCGIGIQREQDCNFVKILNNIMIFRGDLYHFYKLSFKPIYHKRLEAGSRYFRFLTKELDYKIKFLGSGIDNYRIHLRYG